MEKNLKNIVRSGLLLAMAIVIQALGRNLPPQISQFGVGSVVNTVLIMCSYVCGTFWGVLVGALTPLLAWTIGQLPSPMGPFVPFIMIGNAILVLFFGILSKKGYLGKYLGVITGSVLKYLFLFMSASKLIYVFNIGLPKPIAEKLAIMMGIPQLITALIGGTIAIILISILKNRKVID